MEFPGFQAGHRKILFFSRGRGRGHAIPDMQIARAIAQQSNDVNVCFVSYGTGAATLLAHGVSHLDLQLPDHNPINETIVRAGRVIGSLNPDLVVAHEEFSALPAAKIFSKPTILITDWFTDPGALSMGSLRLADRILFLDAPGIYPEPPWVAGRVDYVGPVLRDFAYRRPDRDRARLELGIALDAFVVVVLPGSWPESELPILDTVLAAYHLLEYDSRHLVWVASADAELVRERTATMPNVIVESYVSEIDRIMVAADIAITKANRKTVLELDYLGVPSISISAGANPIDHFRAGLFPNHTMLPAGAEPSQVVSAIQAALSRPIVNSSAVDSSRACAELILDLVGD